MIVDPSASATSAKAAAPANSLASSQTNPDYNTFLTLLVAEMRNQDPTKPMDPTQMVSQLASFSAVEQATKTNSLLSALLTCSSLAQASGLIGRSVASTDRGASGVIRSVTISNDGLTATLDNGATLPLTSGIVIS
jgi:flagellar basal-body rod modification protein FlgD